MSSLIDVPPTPCKVEWVWPGLSAGTYEPREIGGRLAKHHRDRPYYGGSIFGEWRAFVTQHTCDLSSGNSPTVPRHPLGHQNIHCTLQRQRVVGPLEP